MSTYASGLRFGVLVPMHNEGSVIERKLRNALRLNWPESEGQHRLLFVDDHSSDDGVQRLRSLLETTPGVAGVRAECLPNVVRPGKNGALESGLQALRGTVDVIVISDADVVLAPDALLALQRAFEADAQLGMACGTQVFVDALASDGSTPGCGTAAWRETAEPWDRVTRVVRRIESRFGKLFSVHGQWLAWRADLELSPGEGVAADDVDLMLQARCSARPRVRMLPEAVFYECKPATADLQHTQALRRARAWFQVFARSSALARWRGVDALQAKLYGTLPALAPWGLLAFAVGLPLLAGLLSGALGAGVCALAIVLLALTPGGRSGVRTARVILRARRLERAAAMPESWEMLRE